MLNDTDILAYLTNAQYTYSIDACMCAFNSLYCQSVVLLIIVEYIKCLLIATCKTCEHEHSKLIRTERIRILNKHCVRVCVSINDSLF